MRPLRRRRSYGLLLLVIGLVLVFDGDALAEGATKHPAHVDGMAFIDLSDPEGELVEVNLSGKLLKLLASRAIARHDADIAAILSELVSVQAVIADIHADHREEARREIGDVAKKLGRAGWERFVRVRDGKEEYAAYVHFDRAEDVDGIVVMGFFEQNELIFVNLAGRVDMERIALLGDRLGVPGLEELPSTFEIDERRKKRREKSPPDRSLPTQSHPTQSHPTQG